MSFFKYIKTVLRNFKNNFFLLGKFDIQEDIISRCRTSINQARKNIIINYFEINRDEAAQYAEEIQYLKTQRDLPMIPYAQVKEIEQTIQVDYDKKMALPYVLHNGKKLFFPKHWSVEDVRKQYLYFIERENIIGGGFTTKAPHQYQSGDFKIEPGDILLDIGCAEGLVALDSIEKTKQTILYESDPIWDAPLKATFEPYKDKVKIISKWVGDKDSATTTTLNSSTQGLENETFFVKMDIEGAEELVVRGNPDFFKKRKVKVACCTYHKIEHFENINSIFKDWNYSTSPSDGFVLCFVDNTFMPPFFRKGLIRATNIA